ncbi:MAG: hypothetical protein JM58_09650 [Peptococcaceae bacterium BICA1-8]|nr:MAG: hypothetical protein JM58_09650 [Peptococcaceae bacterium BICA1-8]
MQTLREEVNVFVNGKLLKQLIDAKFGSQENFHKQTGISKSFLSSLVNEKADCSLKKLYQIASALDVGMDLLIKDPRKR